jgi:hypothetical protein
MRMQKGIRLDRLRAALGLAALTLLAAPAGAAALRAEQGEVTVVCPMTVGGSFEARTTALEGEVVVDAARPGALEGSFSVDLATLDTGIELRNRHLRESYLEVGKGEGFARAVLSGIRLEAQDLASFEGKAPFHATFLLHGQKREVAGTAELRREGAAVRIQATFPVRVLEHEIAKPSYLGVGVKNEVQVKVTFRASSAPEAEAKDRS